MVEHGGTDLGPAVAWDFSTNANPLPPPEGLSMALAGADRRRYPEPSYLHLRERLARSGLGDADRLLPTAGSAEAIRRLTLLAHLQGVRHVWTPWPGFGEYAAAAEALGLTVSRYSSVEELARRVSARRAAGERATMLLWVCDPCNPTGRCLNEPSWQRLAELCRTMDLMLAADLAYAPLRWPGHASPGEGALPSCVRGIAWQLWSPNKALGMTGVRAGVLVAPPSAERADVDRLLHLAPSWVLSAAGVALLQAWGCRPGCACAPTCPRPGSRCWPACATANRWCRHDGKTSTRRHGAGHHQWGRQELADHRPVPLVRPPGAEGRALQGAEHEQQRPRRARPGRRARRDRQRPVLPGPGRAHVARGAHEPGAAQARARLRQPGGGVGPGARGPARRALAPAQRGLVAPRASGAGRAHGRERRGRHRRRRLARRDQPARQRLRQHAHGAARAGRLPAGHRHRPGWRFRSPLRHAPAAAPR